MDDRFVTQSLHVQPRPRGAKRPQANRDAKDAINIGANRNNRSNRIVEGQRWRGSRRGRNRLMNASCQANGAASGKSRRPLEKRTTIHGHISDRTDDTAIAYLFPPNERHF